MTRQLATMVSSGMTILKALYVLEAQTESKPLAETLDRRCARTSRPACRCRDALERHPKVFNPLFVAMTRAGETGGVLESALLRVADQLEAEDSLRRQVKSAMVYPARDHDASRASSLVALVVFLVPVFEGIFKEFGGELPLITKITVALSDFIIGYWYVGIAGAVGARLRLPEVEGARRRAASSGTRIRLKFAVQDRRRSCRRSRWPAGRARSPR